MYLCNDCLVLYMTKRNIDYIVRPLFVGDTDHKCDGFCGGYASFVVKAA